MQEANYGLNPVYQRFTAPLFCGSSSFIFGFTFGMMAARGFSPEYAMMAASLPFVLSPILHSEELRHRVMYGNPPGFFETWSYIHREPALAMTFFTGVIVGVACSGVPLQQPLLPPKPAALRR